MELEKEIKQNKPFVDPYQKAVVNLIFTHNWVRSEMQEFFKSQGLTSKQYNILRILRGANKKVSTSFIRERMLEKNSDVSRIVDRMFEKGLVQKEGCPKDKRLVDVELSPQGVRILEKVSSEMETVNNIFSKLTKEEVINLNTLLDKIRTR